MSARRSRGVVTAEFSLVLVVFLTLVCGVLEVVRSMYVLNTLQVVTQRAAAAAANADFHDPAAMAAVRQQALFRTGPGQLILGAPITDAHVRIEYLSLSGPAADMLRPIAAGTMPACPVNNRIACMKDPYGPSCIRMVRAQICDPAVGSSCRRVPYRTLVSFVRLPITLPEATAIVSAESLGARQGDAPCP